MFPPRSIRLTPYSPAAGAPAIRVLIAAVLAAALAGCSSAGPAPAAGPSTSAAAALELTHVHGAAFDPGDGGLRLPTHHACSPSESRGSPRSDRCST
ncbi:hypothetical protein [Geodermatophilus maliterrae]|uniref:Uncharacterized protein n=1 Tax=Geodermatophilus maliterrae TaxID=3162531 RepID=A0ABV3XB85_9ACTN